MIFDDWFDLAPELSYLNHAAVAPWPVATRDAVTQFATENARHGATHYPDWLSIEARLRRQLAQLINAPDSRGIALQKSTSEGLSAVAYGLQWAAGDEVIISDQEFPSNRIVWESLQSQGVKVIVAELSNPDPEGAILACFTPRTRLLAISSVQFGTGLTLDLERLGTGCRDANVLLCVDAIQSLGAIPFDNQRVQADFIVADGHKWMLGPEGLALLYVNPIYLETMKLHEFGWHMVAHRGDYDRLDWQPAADALRFECGSPNMLGVVALSSSLELLLNAGIPQVHAAIAQKIAYLEQLVAERPELDLATDTSRPLRSGILTVRHRHIKAPDLYQHLMSHQVICACRGGGVRFSPHCYTSLKALEIAIDAIPEQSL